MVTKSCLELSFRHADIRIRFLVFWKYSGFVNEVSCQACTIKRTIWFHSAIAVFFLGFRASQDFCIVIVYYAFHILHTAVADVERPSIEYPVQWVVNWKMFVDQT